MAKEEVTQTYSTSRLILAIGLIFIVSETSFAQASQKTFKIPTDPSGFISGTHYLPSQSNQKLVLFSGGCNTTQAVFSDMAKRLSNKGFHVVTYDLRGHGSSTALLIEDKVDSSKPPIHSQETHDGLENFHSQDLDLVYSNFEELAADHQVILSMSGCTTSWSFDMIGANPEITNLMFLSTYFADAGARFLDEQKDFNVFVATTDRSSTNTNLLNSFFEANKQHNIARHHCENGYADQMLVECSDLNQSIIEWLEGL